MPLPGQHLLKCEVLAALATTHQSLGETDFQRRCYSKGLEVCKDPSATGADRCATLTLCRLCVPDTSPVLTGTAGLLNGSLPRCWCRAPSAVAGNGGTILWRCKQTTQQRLPLPANPQ